VSHTVRIYNLSTKIQFKLLDGGIGKETGGALGEAGEVWVNERELRRRRGGRGI